MASMQSTVKITVEVVELDCREMTGDEFKDFVLRTLREAIQDGAVIIQPGSHQALILQDADADQG
jgi:hypothetical protein